MPRSVCNAGVHAKARTGHRKRRNWQTPGIAVLRYVTEYAAVVELVDTRDLKSLGRETVPVRARSAAPHSHPDFDRVRVGFFFLIFDELPIFPVF